MTITPQQAMSQIRQDNEPKLKALEERIDQAILRSDGRFPVNISIKVLDAPQSVREECMGMYRSAGWKVDYVSDQRDGDFISITPRESTSRRVRVETEQGSYWGPYAVGGGPGPYE